MEGRIRDLLSYKHKCTDAMSPSRQKVRIWLNNVYLKRNCIFFSSQLRYLVVFVSLMIKDPSAGTDVVEKTET